MFVRAGWNKTALPPFYAVKGQQMMGKLMAWLTRPLSDGPGRILVLRVTFVFLLINGPGKWSVDTVRLKWRRQIGLVEASRSSTTMGLAPAA